MPLNLTVNDGDVTPYIKYNAKAGRFYVRPEGAQQDFEVVNPRLIFDMANIKTGWIFYQEGMGPEKVWDPSASQAAARPAGPRKFKRGFEVMVYGNDQIPSIGPLGLREFSSTASNVITSILRMYNEYEMGARQNPDALPFYVCTGVAPIQGSYGTNYEPQFALKAWVPRMKVPAFANHAANNDSWNAPAQSARQPIQAGRSSVVPPLGGYDEINPPPAEPDDNIPF